MRRQIVAACLLQYIFVEEDGFGEEREGGRTTSFHFQSELRAARTALLGAPSSPRLLAGGLPVGDGRGSGNTIPRVHESVDISIIFKCIKARGRSRWRMKKVEAAPAEEKRFVDTRRTEANGEEERKKTEGKEGRKGERARKVERRERKK